MKPPTGTTWWHMRSGGGKAEQRAEYVFTPADGAMVLWAAVSIHRGMPVLLEELLTASGDILGDHIHTDHRFGDDGTINICHQHTLWQLGAMCKSVGLPQPKPTQSSINKASKELADRIASAECWHQASLKPLPARFTRKAFEACYRDLREVSGSFLLLFSSYSQAVRGENGRRLQGRGLPTWCLSSTLREYSMEGSSQT